MLVKESVYNRMKLGMCGSYSNHIIRNNKWVEVIGRTVTNQHKLMCNEVSGRAVTR